MKFLMLLLLSFLFWQIFADQFKNTNFDWEYYVSINKLNITTEEEAIAHYREIGREQNLEYCQKFKILILLHLYSLELTDEFICLINTCVKNNNMNDYYIKINVPVDDNLNNFNGKVKDVIRKNMKEFAPYHPDLVNDSNKSQLQNIYSYLIENLLIPEKKIDIMFSENRGQDIGSFFLQMDQLKKQHLEFDYLIKLHTKTSVVQWRKQLVSFMNLRLNKLLREYRCIYSIPVQYPDNWTHVVGIAHLVNLLFDHFHYPKRNGFQFNGGTMFIVSSKFTKFIQKNWDFLHWYNQLSFRKRVGFEHAFERFFGFIFELLNLKTLVIYNCYSNGHPAYYGF